MTRLVRIIGFVILVGGVVVFFFGFNSSQSMGEKGMAKITGRYTEGTMKYLIGGLVMIVGGLAIVLNAKRISKDR